MGADIGSSATLPTLRDRRVHRSWPIVVCGLLACISAGLAMVTSPLGERWGTHRTLERVQQHVAYLLSGGSRTRS